MDREELEKTINDLQTDDGQIKPVPQQEGMIAYRKYLWALWFIEKRLERLKEYKNQVVSDIDYKIGKEQETIDRIRQQIEMALEVDPIAERTKSGGMKLSLPDIATVSISKVKDKVIIDDPDTVLGELGEDFKKVKVTLDTTEAKKAIAKMGTPPAGAHMEKDRTLSIRFTK